MLSTGPSLSDAMAGRVVRPGDDGWDAARQAFNLLLDQRPLAVAFPASEHDVVAAVRFAREHGLRLAPQLTGHNAAPLGSLDGAILVNLSQLTDVSIDASARRVRAGAGTRWRDVTPALSELGLAALHGSSPTVGIVGYSLGGGVSWLGRKHGLQASSVTAIELVTADGHLVRADAVREPDLFWALRGGSGNFGVVTAIEFAVHPVERLYAGVLFYPLERAGEVLHAWRELLPSLPDEITSIGRVLRFPDDPALPPHLRGGSFSVVEAAFLGEEADGRELLRPLRELGPAMDTFEMVAPVGLAELHMDPPEPVPYRSATRVLDELPASAIDGLVAVATSDAGAPLLSVEVRHMGGALARRAPGGGARDALPGEAIMYAVGVPDGDEAPVRASLDAVAAALAPHGGREYWNFVEEPVDASAFFDADTWARLRDVKALYDPDDMFRGNHHVPPAE